MTQFKRIFLIVVDSFGIGAMPNAKEYGDEGADTFGHIDLIMNPFHIDTMMKLGLGQLHPTIHAKIDSEPTGYYGRMFEASVGKDTITGHWEMMGLKTEKPFITFTDTGFPDEFIRLFEEKTGRKCVGNKAASGTEIIQEYGEHQIKTGDWIVYTSADSVFQIAANEEVIPLEELYEACQIARELAMDERWKVGRIIARPFIGKKAGEFERTANRHDLALAPFDKTVLDTLKENNFDVIGVGKIPDIFVNQGITRSVKTISNKDGMEKTIELAKTNFNGLCFVNLVDFDAKYGHRRDYQGYGQAIVEFDEQLGELMKYLQADDLLMITADHGNDPTYKGTDHTREQVPLIIYSKELLQPRCLAPMESFSVIGATIAENFNVELPKIGKSILKNII